MMALKTNATPARMVKQTLTRKINMGRRREMDGIWIRSQDKGLYYCKGFSVSDIKNYVTDKNKAYAIVGYVSDEMRPILGWYETETQALQVLDEIQAFITIGTTEAHERDTGATWRRVEKYGVVYVMPES